MRDPERIDEIMQMVWEFWHDNPDLRLGQILTVAAYRGAPYRTPIRDLFNVEDDVLQEGLETMEGQVHQVGGGPEILSVVQLDPDLPPDVWQLVHDDGTVVWDSRVGRPDTYRKS